jgi:hypothetical protein
MTSEELRTTIKLLQKVLEETEKMITQSENSYIKIKGKFYTRKEYLELMDAEFKYKLFDTPKGQEFLTEKEYNYKYVKVEGEDWTQEEYDEWYYGQQYREPVYYDEYK